MAYGAILGQSINIADEVQSGNLNAVTSNAVFEAIQNIPVTTPPICGTYVGTGTHTTWSNPRTLSFDNPPKAVIITSYITSGDFRDPFSAIFINTTDQRITTKTIGTGNEIYSIYVQFTGNQITYGTSGAEESFDAENINYQYAVWF